MKACEAHPGAVYHDVKQDPSRLGEMLKLSNGRRDVPVIFAGGKVTIGFGGS